MAKTKTAPAGSLDLSRFPNFSATGSITGMKKQYYGKDALLIRQGSYIYNVSSEPEIYNNLQNGPISPEEQLTKKGLQVIKWQGMRNSDTGKINAGYLWITFAKDVLILNVEHATNKEYKYTKGEKIAFQLQLSSNRKQAIDRFNRTHVITEC